MLVRWPNYVGFLLVAFGTKVAVKRIVELAALLNRTIVQKHVKDLGITWQGSKPSLADLW